MKTTLKQRMDATRTQAARVRELRSSGMTFRAIGEAIGVCAGRAAQIWNKEEKRINEKHWTDGLDVRTANCLNNSGATNREEALALFKLWDSKQKRKPLNYGRGSHEILAEWLGLPKPEKKTKAKLLPPVCPHCGGSLGLGQLPNK